MDREKGVKMEENPYVSVATGIATELGKEFFGRAVDAGIESFAAGTLLH